ncbi:glycoside hydrolase family 65 protein [Butyrivibrio sp. MC2013]|uniref:glycoside hydrolase family 65 protein n=1 Tax=Butyrivibrio sp. MC2013 TaxID=1280686 RepID=UPI000427C22D|nr:glycosyl hydrolase family 65 protein [Butyrivibrio sp. MC2013]
MNKRIISRNMTHADDKERMLAETLFSTANGYLGVRGCNEEGLPDGKNTCRGMYLNGVYEIIPMKQAESLFGLIEEKQTMINSGDLQTVYISIDGERMEYGKGTVLSEIRSLDMDKGISIREVRWRSESGKEIELRVKRMTSFVLKNLFILDMEVRSLNFEGDIAFEALHIAKANNYANPDDPRMAAEGNCYLEPQRIEALKDRSLSLTKTRVSGITVAIASAHECTAAGKKIDCVYNKEGEKVIYRAGCRLKENDTAVLTGYVVFADSLREEDPGASVMTMLDSAISNKSAYYYDAQEQYMAAFWDNADMEILGDEDSSLSACFNIYQLLQSAGTMKRSSIAAKGLSGEGYEGHYFWDTEMFLMPFFNLTDREVARSLISYRYDTLKEARENARLLGHKKGALYPWRTINGTECSGYYVSGTAAYHINGAIAYAICSYYDISGDIDFMMDKGEEILLETARLWRCAGSYYKDRFMLFDVTGPDEYTCMVNNNYYTNLCAAYNMERAAQIMEEITVIDGGRLMDKLSSSREELESLKEAAKKIYLPYDEELGINPQDDSFLQKPVWDIEATPKEEFPLLMHHHPLELYRYQVCKQADTVLAHFLFEDRVDAETRKKSFEYYEKITTHDSSLSRCVFAIAAARLGEKKKALSYFGDSVKMDLMNLQGNTGDGIHTANMGGSYMAIVYGFAGLTIRRDELSLDPFVPDSWKGYRFRFKKGDSRIEVCVLTDEVTVTLLDGPELSIKVWGEDHLLKADSPLKLHQKK